MSIKYFISVPNTHDVFVTFTKGVVSLLELVRQPPPTVLHGLGESQQQHQQQLLQGGLPPSAAVTPTTGEHTAVVHLGSNDERSTNTSLDTRPMAATAASALPSRRQPLMPRSMECEDDEEVAAHNSGGVDWGPSGPHALQRMTSLDSMFQFPPTPQLRPVLEDHYNRQASEDAMLLLSESEMLNVSNASMDNNNNIQAMAGGDSGGGEDSPPMPILRPTPGDAPQFGTNNLLRPRGPAAPHHRHASPTVRPPQLQEHSGNWTNGNPTHTCVPVVRSAVCLPHDVVATCFCPSAPVERRLFAELAEGRQQPPAPGDAVGNSGSDVFVAVGTRSGMLAIVRCGRSASEQLVVARCTPPHVTLRSPSTAGGGDTAGTAGTAGGAGASNTAAGGTGNNTSAFQNYAFEDSEWDSCTTVVWVRAQPIIGVGHASGRIAWYYVEASSSVASPLSATVAPLYGEPRHHDNADAAVTITLTHIATYPAYMSNRMAYVASSNELTQSGMVVFSTQEEVLLFDVRCDASGRSPARPMEPLGSVKQRRSRDAPLDGRAIAFRRNPSSPVAPHHQASSFGGYDPQRLARTVGVLPRGGDYVACHPSLPYFALLGRGKPLHVSESGTMSSNCTPAGALRTTHGAPPAELQSPPVTPATMTPGSAGTGAPSTTPLHLQIFEVRKQVAHACGAARLVRQSIRTDAILDAAWRFSADLTLMVNISDESNLRLYTFSYQQQSTPQSTGGGGGSTANDNAPTSSSLQWGDRIVPFASHGAIVNVEWMSAAASCFNQQHRDVVLAKEGRHYAPGFGEASHVVGVGLRGEIAITTIMPDPAISWCDDHHVVVGTGSTLCIFGTTSACDDMVPAAAAAAAAGRSASGSMVHLAVNDPTSCGVAVETMMLLRSQAGFGIDPRLCEKALRSFRAAVANGGGGRKLPPPTFLEILCRYMTALEQVGVCAAHGRVPGVLQWLSYPHDSVPTHDQLLEAGMYTKDSVFYCPSSLSSTNSYFGGGHHQTTRENDPRRILLLYVFGWIPTPPPNRSPLGAGLGGGTTASTTGSSSSSLSNSSYLRVTAPWLTDIDDVERLAAILVYYGQLQEASAVLHVHHTLQPAFAPIAGLLLTMHTNRCRQQQQQLQMSTLAQQQQSSAPPFASTAGMSDPATNRVLSALPEGISNAMGPELYAAITDACSGPSPAPVHWGGDLSTISSCSTTSAGSYDDPSLSMIDRIMIAVLKHPNIAELTETLRTCFLTSNCNPVLRLLLEGIHEGTASLMQRHVDVTADVQLAACLFARMGVLHTAGTAAAGNRSATVPMDGTLASLGQYRPTTSSGSAAVVWSSWAATYRTFLMDRGLFVQRSLFDIHVKRLEASVRGKGPVAMHAPSRCPPGRQPMGSCERQDTTGDDCVCKGRGNTLHMRPAHAATVAAAVRQCSVCGDRLAPGLGGTQAARAHFLQLASATSNMDSDAAATSNRNACRLTMLMRTAFVWCTVCGHGGHVSHLQSWFASHAHCPSSGCSCKCAASQSR